MSKENKRPDIRFEGFNSEWEEQTLNNILTVNSGRDYKHLKFGDIPVYGTGGYMLSVNEALSHKDAIGIGRKGTIDKPQRLRAPFWTVDTLFYMIPDDENDLRFLFSLMETINWKQYDESTGVPSLSRKKINSIEVNIPEINEQREIGSFLHKIDKNIITTQKRLSLIKNFKQAMIQRMFPKEGELKPIMRFEGFSEEWREYQLRDLANIVGGGTPSTTNAGYWNGDIDWYSPVEIGDKDYVDSSQNKITKFGLDSSSAKILPAGTVLFTSRAGIGKTAILAKEGATNQGFQSIIPHENLLDSYFIYSRTNELKRYGESKGAGSTFAEISGKQMEKMPILIPSLEEQKVIGNYFEVLDKHIKAKKDELTKLRQFKQAMLNNMFI